MAPGASRALRDGPARGLGLAPVLLVIVSVASTQFGAAVAKGLFDRLGPTGTVFLRVAFAAVVLLVLWRPRLRGHPRADARAAIAFGLALAAMNLTFYLALERIPLGIAVTVEFVGPLGVAVALSHRRLDLVWVVLAAAGLALLAPWGGDLDLDRAGLALALAAGGCWAAYILLSARVGQVFPGGSGLALAMGIAAGALLPVGVASAGGELLIPGLLAVGLAVALLSSAIPYSLELEALRRMPTSTFGVLLSLEPAVAALAGWVVLSEALGSRELAAIALVVLASAGATWAGRRPAGPGQP